MAAEAVSKHGCSLAVLLGDDTEVEPPGWSHLVLTEFEAQPDLMLLLLTDAADPGFPSFPVLRVDRHLELFGCLLPHCFVNQGGDPYLAALYRRWQGCLAVLPSVTVTNQVGGVQRAEQPYTQPRYSCCTISKVQMLDELKASTAVLEAASSSSSDGSNDIQDIDRLQQAPAGDCDLPSGSTALHFPSRRLLYVDVLVPTARLDLGLLQGIADAVLAQEPPAGCDLHLVLVVDRPARHITSLQQQWLQQLQARWLHSVRIRINEENLGASATRNRALQESLADYVIMWDDDIQPAPGCLAAYVGAMIKHPKALGFAGPSYVPKDPGSVWCCAVHMADVLFFWDAAADWKVAEALPWAVTANLAVINTCHTFDLRFLKTGGGEDIDYCLKVTEGRMMPVPQASVTHPLWSRGSRCYDRFYGWAYGDGALIAMYPQLCYTSWPNAAEACGLLLLLAVLAAGAACVLYLLAQLQLATLLVGPEEISAAATAATAARVLGSSCWSALGFTQGLVRAAVGFKLMDMVLDVVRAFHPVRVRKHPCSASLLRVAAAVEASLIKTWSEFGRLAGLISRGELLPRAWTVPLAGGLLQSGLLRRFDWFCGLSKAVVAGERRRGALRFLACSCGAAAAAGWLDGRYVCQLYTSSFSAHPWAIAARGSATGFEGCSAAALQLVAVLALCCTALWFGEG